MSRRIPINGGSIAASIIPGKEGWIKGEVQATASVTLNFAGGTDEDAALDQLFDLLEKARDRALALSNLTQARETVREIEKEPALTELADRASEKEEVEVVFPETDIPAPPQIEKKPITRKRAPKKTAEPEIGFCVEFLERSKCVDLRDRVVTLLPKLTAPQAHMLSVGICMMDEFKSDPSLIEKMTDDELLWECGGVVHVLTDGKEDNVEKLTAAKWKKMQNNLETLVGGAK